MRATASAAPSVVHTEIEAIQALIKWGQLTLGEPVPPDLCNYLHMLTWTGTAVSKQRFGVAADTVGVRALFLTVAAMTGCTKTNPNLCCTDEADCTSHGIAMGSTCSNGLVCRGNQCIAETCSTTGDCEAGAPYCIDGLCGMACTDSAQCPGFGQAATDRFCTNGTCVECVVSTDCPTDRPVCDANACRGCSIDSECDTGACADDGTCVLADGVVYLDPAGTDAGNCDRSAPCRTFGYGVPRTTPTREHIVMATGGYVENVYIAVASTTASHLFIHGGNASLTGVPGIDQDVFHTYVGITLRDLDISAPTIRAVSLSATDPSTLEHVTIEGASVGIAVAGSTTIRDIDISDATYGITLDGDLTVDRLVIRRGMKGIESATTLSTMLHATNMLIYGTSDLAVDIGMNTSGTIDSSTIADSGSDSGTGPRAVQCGGAVTLRSSIVWAPGTTPRAPFAGCNTAGTIAGPTPVSGTMNVDPQFVDAPNRDYHIAATSPARDAVDTGPASDFEGDARPRGTRYDIGADEAP